MAWVKETIPYTPESSGMVIAIAILMIEYLIF